MYKYLPPERIDVLQKRRIRFTQPADFNDPFEFRPVIKEINTEDAVKDYVEKNFEQLVEKELAKYGAIAPALAKNDFSEIITAQKQNVPILFQMLSPALINSIRAKITELLNQHVGVLCLSKVKDSILMWGHYAANHCGFVVGFDSEDSFFKKRRSETDEFGFLRKVNYTMHRPKVTLADSDSVVWFEQKHVDWKYEKEWRILRVLHEADSINNHLPFPIHLFGFPISAVREVIVGMNSDETFRNKMRALTKIFPNARFLIANEHHEDYRVTIDQDN
ncbi:MAG TPA: DUF2971 domain-containing protein [Verrucomicrobiae bacterium]|nr:DUF2971 domain-containing protein [Verrucomicrobiae bacterium]